MKKTKKITNSGFVALYEPDEKGSMLNRPIVIYKTTDQSDSAIHQNEPIGQIIFGELDKYRVSEMIIKFNQCFPDVQHAAIVRSVLTRVMKGANISLVKSKVVAENLDLFYWLDAKDDETDSDYFIIERYRAHWSFWYALLGMMIGNTFGRFSEVFDQTMTIIVGLCLGLSIGLLLEANAKKKTDRVIEARKKDKEDKDSRR